MTTAEKKAAPQPADAQAENGLGAPVLPGAMFMLAYKNDGERKIPICGLPGCVMYAKRTIFDLVLPRIMSDEVLTTEDFSVLGEGGFCLNCPVCTFPNCGFGKGQ